MIKCQRDGIPGLLRLFLIQTSSGHICYINKLTEKSWGGPFKAVSLASFSFLLNPGLDRLFGLF